MQTRQFRDRGWIYRTTPTSCRLLIVGVAGLLCLGCGRGVPRTAPVSGVVKYRGQPVAGASVMFMPAGQRAATADTDESGRFKLSTFSSGDGAIVGTHSVTIVKKEAIPDPKAKDSPYRMARDVLPPRYGMVNSSGLKVDVPPEGNENLVFDLVD
jgi:hypothetical protein